MTSLIRRVAGTERRDSLSNPSPELVEALTQGQFGPSYTGKTVTPKNALALVAVFSCVDLLSRTVGSLPCHLYEKNDDGTPTEVTGTPLAELLTPRGERRARRRRPVRARDGPPAAARQRVPLEGARPFGRVSALWPILPSRVRVGRDRSARRSSRSRTRRPAASPPAPRATSCTSAGWASTGSSASPRSRWPARRSASTPHTRSTRAASTPTTRRPAATSPSRKARRSTPRASSSSRPTGTARTAASPPPARSACSRTGRSSRQLSISMKDQEFIDQQHFSISQVCNLFRVPQWMLGEATGDSLTYATVEQQGEFFATYSISTWCHRIERSLRLDGDLFVDPRSTRSSTWTRCCAPTCSPATRRTRSASTPGSSAAAKRAPRRTCRPRPTSVPEFGPLPRPPATRPRTFLDAVAIRPEDE
jgi:hypothetical protein